MLSLLGEEEGIGGVVGDKEEANPDCVTHRALLEGCHKYHKHRESIRDSRILHKGHSTSVLVCAPVGKAGNKGVGNRVNHLAYTRKQGHNGKEAKQLILRKKGGQTALYCRLEEVQKIVTYHAVEKALGNIG